MIEINNGDQKAHAGRRVKMTRTLAGLSRKDLEDKYGISMHRWKFKKPHEGSL